MVASINQKQIVGISAVNLLKNKTKKKEETRKRLKYMRLKRIN